MTARLPALFVPHGSPTFALEPGAAGAAIAAAAAALPAPRAIVIVSAHWETDVATVGVAPRLETIHDFYGFPQELYQLNYPATGCPEASREVVQALEGAGLPVAQDPTRGLDHGAWIPLRLMFPDADIPVVPLSIQSHLGVAGALRLGRALEPLTRAGFLVIASGNITHSLRDFHLAWRNGGQAPDYVHAFPQWMAEHLAAHDDAALLDYRRRAPEAVRAHPTDEHLLPLYVAYGAGGAAPRVERLHAGVDSFVIAMDAYAFTAQ